MYCWILLANVCLLVCWPHYTAYGILVPEQGTEPELWTIQSASCWTIRKVPLANTWMSNFASVTSKILEIYIYIVSFLYIIYNISYILFLYKQSPELQADSLPTEIYIYSTAFGFVIRIVSVLWNEFENLSLQFFGIVWEVEVLMLLNAS